MRNFIFFIRRFFNLILFLAFEIVCIIMIQRSDTVQGNDIVNSANVIAGEVYKKENDVVSYFALRKMNDSLLNENARLRESLGKYISVDTLKDTVVQIAEPQTDTSIHIVEYADYVYRSAKVINNATANTDNYITINRGRKHGIRKGMAVLSGTGIAGRVEQVSNNFSSILSVLSSKQKVSAKLKNGTNGVVIWSTENPHVLTMTELPQHSIIMKGDSVFTSDYSLYFPPDILIGTVIKTIAVKKKASQKVYLWSSTDFENLRYVYVVENTMADEEKEVRTTTAKK